MSGNTSADVKLGGSGTLIGPVLGTVAVEVLTYVLADIDAIKVVLAVDQEICALGQILA